MPDGGSALSELLRSRRAVIAEAGERLLGGHLQEGERVPDLGVLAELCARRIEAAAAGAAPPPDAAAAGELGAALAELQKLVAPTLFGRRWAEKLKLPDVLPSDPAALGGIARDVVKALKKKKLLKPGVKGMLPIDGAHWIDRIKKPLKRLEGKDAAGDKKQRRAAAAALGAEAALAAALLVIAGEEPKRKRGKKAASASSAG